MSTSGRATGQPAERVHSLADEIDIVKGVVKGFGRHQSGVSYACLKMDDCSSAFFDVNGRTKLRRKADASL